MAYLKADDILPPELLRSLQEYVQGAALYIPRSSPDRQGWGQRNGARAMIDARNEAIREAKAEGASLEELADRHSISVDAIRKVLYSVKKSA